MASPRTGYGLPARPSDGFRPRVGEDSVPRGSIPRPAHRTGLKDSDVPRSARLVSSPPKTTTIPQQAYTSRSSILPRPSSRSVSETQVKSSSTGSRTSSETARSHHQTASSSSSSSRSVETTAKSNQNWFKRSRAPVSRDLGSSRKDLTHSSPQDSAKPSEGPLDSGLGIQYDRKKTESPAERRIAITKNREPLAQAPVIYPELDRYREFQRPDYTFDRPEIDVPFRLATQDLPPPTPMSQLFSGGSSSVSAFSGSPSTKFSESPGPGPYSRDTTPTSMSSQSPIFVAPNRPGVQHRSGRHYNVSTTRPPVTKRRAGSFTNDSETTVDPHGLASVRESLTSSSSNSTVKGADKAMRKEKVRTRHLLPPPPSPPPRKSSQKLRRPKEGSDVSDSPQLPIFEPKDSPAEREVQSPSRPNTSSPPQVGPPARPSRHNTPDMKTQLFSPVPVIHSNLVSTIRAPEGRGSGSLATTSLPGSTTSLSQPRQNASSSSLSLGHESTHAASRSQTSFDKQRKNSSDTNLVVQAAQSSSRSASRSRFAFFGRKKTSSDNTKRDEHADAKKSSRKGPVAGTGHEGYGRVGAVRRRSGSGSALPRNLTDPVSSCDSLASADSFLSDRMNPVIISGGEVVENRNASAELSRVETNHSIPSRPSTESKASSEVSSTSRNHSRSALRPSALPRSQAFTRRRPSDSSDSDDVGMESTLAFRRSVQRLGSSPDSPLRLPQPIQINGDSHPSPLTSFDASLLSDESHMELQRDLAQESNWQPPATKKLKKKPRSPRKWNLFSRSQSQPNTKKVADSEEVRATVKAVDKRPVAFYTIMDNTEQEETEHMDIQEVLRQADVYHQPSIRENDDCLPPVLHSSRLHVMESPPPHSWQASPDSHSVTTIASSSAADTSSQTLAGGLNHNTRPSRLQQVGRIPQVVKKSTENISPQSFSRPFRASLQPPTNFGPVMYDPESIATGPTPPKPSTPIASTPGEGLTSEAGMSFAPYRNSISQNSADIDQGEKEFLSFSPRKNSTGTNYTSSSNSSGANPFSTATAIIPKPEDPPAEDEIWDEYDDLIGDEAMKGRQSTTSSKGTPFHLEAYQRKLTRGKELDSPTVANVGQKLSTYSTAPTHSSSYSADMTERIRTAFQPKPLSTTSDALVPRADEPKVSSDKNLVPKDDPASKRHSSSSCRTVFSDCSSCSSNDGSPLAQVNLRVGSMTVSKWLTFGHVLFSDVRHELSLVKTSLKQHSILVIDGLGNDDWSFYAAETYPSTSFFNLSPRAPLPAELKNSPTGFPLSPPNHHQVQYTSHLEKFPFLPQSFDAVVYRFPPAASEDHYRNILTEARRVLRPNGYIELSILDSDLNNMGNRGRRTIRQLKEKIQQTTPDTSFASTADLIVRLLGRAGFSSIKAARVGVPVASPITRSAGHGTKDKAGSDKKKDPPSLAEMMSDTSPLADENITKIVTRVGRWWYSRCYENVSGSGSKRSIWDNKALLSECEQFGTSLKLMVCCARAPERINSL